MRKIQLKFMLFSSTVFLFLFLPFVITVYYFLPKDYRNLFLLGASLFFYAFGEPIYLWLFILSICINHTGGYYIEKYRNKAACFAILFAVLFLDIGLLGFYKYGNFIIQNWNRLTGIFELPFIHYESIHLPIGISFFTFQAMSYVIDVYRCECKAQKNLLHSALYISFFPQLIAGPIVRYVDIAHALKNRLETTELFSSGVKRFIVGMGKKVLIADAAGGLADKMFAIPGAMIPTSCAWLGVIAYTIQIYYDFSGYSDMAIGMGRMFGFNFLENFNYPYISKSITEFWRRWHISLSTWFRDYLYIPLGGNRRTPTRTLIHLILVFFLCGLWHGASWTFVVWGLYHGTFLVLERVGVGCFLTKLNLALRHLYTLFIVMMGWVIFRCNTLKEAMDYLFALIGLRTGDCLRYNFPIYLNQKILIILGLGILGSIPILPWMRKKLSLNMGNMPLSCSLTRIFALNTLSIVGLIGVLAFCAMTLATGTYNAFIYFRF